LLKSYGRSRRSSRTRALGQHMLVSEELANKIVLLSCIRPEDRVLEIGTGSGMLTGKLTRFAKSVRSYEVDKKLYEESKGTLSGHANIELILGDAFEKESYFIFDVCVTNLPYSQSLKFVKWLCQRPDRFRLTVATLQSEFAQKLLSAPAKESYRAISVIAQLSFDMDSLFLISREAFDPKPTVTSEVVKFSPKGGIGWPVLGKNQIALLNFLFSFRGRQLSSPLRKLVGKDFPPSFSKELLSKRIEALTVEEFSFIIEEIGAAQS
jgi:16S rRNA A1518/A1519 N6-dimethyltransferase RsmA/KsgA/DIM1 with predicted DNA glycosylase/AP lyase activity